MMSPHSFERTAAAARDASSGPCVCADADDIDGLGRLDEEEHVAPDPVAAVALADVSGSPAPWVGRYAFDRCADLGDVLLGLARVPVFAVKSQISDRSRCAAGVSR